MNAFLAALQRFHTAGVRRANSLEKRVAVLENENGVLIKAVGTLQDVAQRHERDLHAATLLFQDLIRRVRTLEEEVSLTSITAETPRCH